MATFPLAATTISSLLLLSLLPSTAASPPTTTTITTPYLSETTLFTNYKTMLKTFKIFIYPSSAPPPRRIPPETATVATDTRLISLFQDSLLSTPFLTQDPGKAHLFFIPFPPHYSTRSLSRLISDLRSSYPYWNRTLGADHFFVCSPRDIGPSSSRNVVELKKNSIRISSSFPSPPGHFIPHKDISFPPPLQLADSLAPTTEESNSGTSAPSRHTYLGYLRWDENKVQEVVVGSASESSLSNLISQLNFDPSNFLIESETSDGDASGRINNLKRSKFCLFVYEVDQAAIGLVGEAMSQGCVPVFITDGRPIQELPLMDVLRWHDLALFVGTRVGVDGIKGMLSGLKEEEYERMRRLGAVASKHFIWNVNPEPFDAFSMLMYQLWNRRFVVRYATY